MVRDILGLGRQGGGAVLERKVVRWVCALAPLLVLASSGAWASGASSQVLGFESPAEWMVVEGNGELTLEADGAEGGALRVGGSFWRKLESSALSSVGASENNVTLDVSLEAAASSWETVGVILRAPSIGVHWTDLGTVSLGGLEPGRFHTLAFPLSEQTRQALNGSYSDLRLSITLNAQGAVTLDRLVFTALPGGMGGSGGSAGTSSAGASGSGASPGDPTPGGGGACAHRELRITDLAGDMRDWM
jgi:hypothetical protein